MVLSGRNPSTPTVDMGTSIMCQTRLSRHW